MQDPGNKVTIVFIRKAKVMCSWSSIRAYVYLFIELVICIAS